MNSAEVREAMKREADEDGKNALKTPLGVWALVLFGVVGLLSLLIMSLATK